MEYTKPTTEERQTTSEARRILMMDYGLSYAEAECWLETGSVGTNADRREYAYSYSTLDAVDGTTEEQEASERLVADWYSCLNETGAYLEQV